MQNFNKWNWEEAILLHPVEKAAKVHTDFVKIHPFIDGNGRTARLLLNLELMKHGYPPIVIKNEKKIDYYIAIDKAHTEGDYNNFIQIVVDEMNNSLDLYLELLD